MRNLLIAGLIFAGSSMTAGGNEPTELQVKLRLNNPAVEHRNILKLKPAAFTKGAMGEEDREAHGPGLFANVGLFMPNQDYMDPYFIPELGLFKTGYTAEVGNYFRFFHTDNFGVGLRATWIQLGYTAHADTAFLDGNWFGSPIRLGPQVSYAINEMIGIDAFYQLGAQYNMSWYNGENSSYAGITHEAGLGVRFMMFTAGAAVKFGRLPNIDNSDPVIPLDDLFKYSAGGLRIFVGIQL